MEKIHFTPKRYSLISLALGICFFMASLFFTIREGVFDNSRSIFGFLSGIVLLSLLVMSVYYLLKRPSLIIDEKGLSQTGFRAVNMLWDDIEEVKNHFILSQDFISIKTKGSGDQKGKWVNIYVMPYAANADVLVNFMRDMAKTPADQRKYMMHNLDWLGVKTISVH
ncbi:MAG: hypothetical protein KBF57_09935 [Saprospiraceae bacterium]|jgi:hypothetical protein|nr:hypothetical protein [Saprospiraceae bacterium]